MMGVSMLFGRMKVIWLFLSIALFYSAWMTGFTFEYSECKMFPNYNFLAEAFTNGRLDLDSDLRTDTIVKDGKHYLYAGPVPALLRLPGIYIFNRGIPTGFMVALFCAGTCTLFLLIIKELTPSKKTEFSFTITVTLMLTFIFNGFSLLMVTIPTFHNEAISSAMFFLLVSIFLLLRMQKNNFRVATGTSILFGIILSMAICSRFTYVFPVIVIGCIFMHGVLTSSASIPKGKKILPLLIVVGIGLASLGLLFWYNKARFGAFLDFGLKWTTVSQYRDYMIHYGVFRYDHFPHNFWSYFFRIPQFTTEFPFLVLPAYMHVIQSVGGMNYLLVNGNELAVSIFYLMPITAIAFIPLFYKKVRVEFKNNKYLIIAVLFVIQVIVISLTPAAIARYYYDFLPLMMIMVFIGAVRMQTNKKMSNAIFGCLGTISVLISFSLPMNAIQFYAMYIKYKSPLLDIFF